MGIGICAKTRGPTVHVQVREIVRTPPELVHIRRKKKHPKNGGIDATARIYYMSQIPRMSDLSRLNSISLLITSINI